MVRSIASPTVFPTEPIALPVHPKNLERTLDVSFGVEVCGITGVVVTPARGTTFPIKGGGCLKLIADAIDETNGDVVPALAGFIPTISAEVEGAAGAAGEPAAPPLAGTMPAMRGESAIYFIEVLLRVPPLLWAVLMRVTSSN